jgi:hypothetical protein
VIARAGNSKRSLHKTILLCEKGDKMERKRKKMQINEKKVGIFGGMWGKMINFAGEVL